MAELLPGRRQLADALHDVLADLGYPDLDTARVVEQLTATDEGRDAVAACSNELAGEKIKASFAKLGDEIAGLFSGIAAPNRETRRAAPRKKAAGRKAAPKR